MAHFRLKFNHWTHSSRSSNATHFYITSNWYHFLQFNPGTVLATTMFRFWILKGYDNHKRPLIFISSMMLEMKWAYFSVRNGNSVWDWTFFDDQRRVLISDDCRMVHYCISHGELINILNVYVYENNIFMYIFYILRAPIRNKHHSCS